MTPKLAERQNEVEQTPLTERIGMFMSGGIDDARYWTHGPLPTEGSGINTLGWESELINRNLHGHNMIGHALSHLNAAIELVNAPTVSMEPDADIAILAYTLSCSLDILQSVSSEGIIATIEVHQFICGEIPIADAAFIARGLKDLKRIARDAFPNLAFISLELFVDAEWPEERNILIKLHLNKHEKHSHTYYREYTREFCKTFPIEFRKWFRTSLVRI